MNTNPHRLSLRHLVLTFTLALVFLFFSISHAVAQEPAVPDQPTLPASPEIVGGQPADPGEYPWQVIILRDG